MSETFDFNLEDVDDFADVTVEDPSAYSDQTGPAPLAPGNYRFAVVQGGRRTGQNGEPIDDNGYPQVQLSRLRIVEPEEFVGREIYPFQTYSLRPVQNGLRKGSVPVIDLLRAFDDTQVVSNGKEALQLLAEAISNGKTFVAGTNWVAKDSEAIKEFIDENGGDLNDVDSDVKRAFFKKAIIRGQKSFPKDGNGGFKSEIVGPSGDVLEARVTLTRLYPASKEVKKLGPYSKKEAK